MDYGARKIEKATELEKVSRRLDQIASHLGDCKTEASYEKLMAQEKRLKPKEQELKDEIQILDGLITDGKRRAVMLDGLHERERKEKLLAKILAGPAPVCPGCGSNELMRPRDNMPVPIFNYGSWTTKIDHSNWNAWRVEFLCDRFPMRCLKPVALYPDHFSEKGKPDGPFAEGGI